MKKKWRCSRHTAIPDRFLVNIASHSARAMLYATDFDSMKKTSRATKTIKELQAEYRFDYSQAKPNRFAAKVEVDALVVVLDPDAAEVFTSSEAVNTALRALLTAIPNKLQSKSTRK